MNILRHAKVILIVNDDGYLSNGLKRIQHYIMQSLQSTKHNNLNSLKDIKIISLTPDRDMSGSGASITVNRELKVHYIGNYGIIDEYAVDGTPVDCIHIGGTLLSDIGLFPDLVISGINEGPNLADDLIYSGTFCAAREANIIGIPSLAISYNGPKKDLIIGSPEHDIITKFLDDIFDCFFTLNYSTKDLINVNIPTIEMKRMSEILSKDANSNIKFTSVGERFHEFSTEESATNKFRIGLIGDFKEPNNLEDIDHVELMKGFISYTHIKNSTLS